MPPKHLPHVRHIRSKGRDYYYFDTGRRDHRGKRIYTRLPDIRAREFGGAYASMLGHRNRSPASYLTIPTLIDLYQKSPVYREKAQSTREAYDMYLARLAKLLPTAPAAEVTRADMLRLIDGMADTPGAANLFLGTCGAMFKWAVERREEITSNPCSGITPLPMGEHDPWPVPLLNAGLACDDRFVRLLVHLLYFTAQRIGDVLKMQWSDIEGDKLRLRQQKTKKHLSLRLHRTLERELAKTPRAGLLIVLRDDGRPVTIDYARAKLKAFAADRGFKVVPHGLRKNAVNALLEAGCSVAETAAISGQSLQMVEHYAKARDQDALGSAAVLKWERNGS